MDIIYNPINSTWGWVHGYEPWIIQLQLALNDVFGADTGQVDRQGRPIHIGDILSGAQHNFIWSGGYQGETSGGCDCKNASTNPVSLTPQEWAAQHNPTTQTPPFPPTNPYQNPHIDPWNVFDPHIVQLPDRTCKTYFIYNDPTLGIVGRTFFECEKLNLCTTVETNEMYLSDFSNVVYIGNLVDTPEQLLLNHMDQSRDTISPRFFLQKNAENHFR